MITRLKTRLNTFRAEEDGAAYTVEFAVMMPILFMTLVFGVELTTHSNRQFQLDRALASTTRAIRLHTGDTLTHADLVENICDNSGGLADCEENMRLEMITVDPREYEGLPDAPDCTNAPQEVTPVRGWSVGESHDLMLLRACYQYEPFLTSVGLGKLLTENTDNSKASIIALSAFVQEPE